MWPVPGGMTCFDAYSLEGPTSLLTGGRIVLSCGGKDRCRYPSSQTMARTQQLYSQHKDRNGSDHASEANQCAIGTGTTRWKIIIDRHGSSNPIRRTGRALLGLRGIAETSPSPS